MKSFKSIKIIASLFSFALLATPIFVFAQIQNPLKLGTDIPAFISMLLGYVVKIGGIVAVCGYIYDGFLFVQAQGNPGAITKAQDTFVNITIGVAVLLGAQLIASIIVGTLNSLR